MSWGVEDAFPVQQQHALSESSASAVTAIVKVEKETKSRQNWLVVYLPL